jgi:hypothetical protein
MINPLDRIRRERRWTIIFFNVLLLIAALMQWLALHGRSELEAIPRTAPFQVNGKE